MVQPLQFSPGRYSDRIPGSNESGNKLWGVTKANWGPLPLGGIQLTNPVTLGEFETGVEPQLLEVRFTTLWAPVTLVGPFTEGLLQAKIVYGSGAANHSVVCDVSLSTAILVPAGTINVSLQQVGMFSRALVAVSVSIAKYAGAQLAPATCSIVPTETLIVGPPDFWRSSGAIPQRARAAFVVGRYSTGLHTLTFASGTGGQLMNYDSGSDRLLMQTGCPVPVTADTWTLLRPGVVPAIAREPIVSFLLD
jgi:hypothetical protein